MAKTIVYVDGYNVFYGLFHSRDFENDKQRKCVLELQNYRYVNIKQYYTEMLPHDEVMKIYYFTAKLKGALLRQRQQMYLDAIRAVQGPELRIVFGKFMTYRKQCKVNGCLTPEKMRNYFASEEKGTDVNIALQMLDDFHHGLVKKMVLVTNDSDLVPVIRFISKQRKHDEKYKNNVQLHVLFPSIRGKKERFGAELSRFSDKSGYVDIESIKKFQLSGKIALGDSGKFIDIEQMKKDSSYSNYAGNLDG